jgi:insertion element IS1 protein InsB
MRAANVSVIGSSTMAPPRLGPGRPHLEPRLRSGAREEARARRRTRILELDEMWQYLKKKRHTRWLWKALDRDMGQRLDSESGRRDKATVQKLIDRLPQGDVKLYGTDTWATYAAVIPADKLVQSKATTHDIERNHCRQCHWFGRFTRKSSIISTSQEMVDLTRALCATLWINGNQDELLLRLA